MNDTRLTTTSHKPLIFHHYRTETIIGLTAVFLVSWFMMFALDTSIGVFGLLALIVEFIVVLTLDWHGVTQLRGRISRRRLPWPAQVILGGIAFFFLLLWFIPYLIFVWRDRGSEAQREARLKRQSIAQLEVQLGILPSAEGECANCHKPLQVGAEFCAYCGTEVAPRPRVCPSCGEPTFPDARFCPECGTSLEGATSR